MRPDRIILVRHGMSEGNSDQNAYAFTPDYALNLTEEGIRQALRAGKDIKALIGSESISVYLSPYVRTRQTFRHIRESIGDNVVETFEDPRLREQDWGHLRSSDKNEEIIHARENFSPFYYRIADGESGADVYDRISTFLETLYRDFSQSDYPKNVLIVTHGFALRIFLMRWYHWSVEEFEDLHNPRNCQVVVMERRADNRYELVSKLAKRSED